MIRPIFSDQPGEWHRAAFAQFAAAKAAVGEPTPHMRVLEHMCRGIPEPERIWRAGCYAAGYSLLTAEAIWREWPRERVRQQGAELLEYWLRENWAGIHTRVPRRTVRTPQKMARCLLSYDAWSRNVLPALDPEMPYDEWWAAVDSDAGPWSFGRYIAIRLLELYRRWGMMRAPLHDIRAVGAHSPIRCLMLLYPEEAEGLATGERGIVDAVANLALVHLRYELPDMTPFTFAALLCEYRKAYEDRGDYAGNQTDEELAYLNGPHLRHWISRGYATGIWTARQMTTEARYLGEKQGWSGRRPEAASALREYGIVWDDRVYDYAATRENGGAPVRWQ